MLQRLLITGAAGGLGRVASARLGGLAERLRLSDIVDVAPSGDHQEFVRCDLGDKAAVDELVADCDGIVHLGGVSVEDGFTKILNANIQGVFNLYEAARRHGVGRILFASSNHVIGLHTQDTHLDADAPIRPDSLYGLSKSYGEGMAHLYHHKHGIETAIVRIGSCFERPRNYRMLATWMSFDDFTALAETVFTVPRLGCPIIYGVSDNDVCWWDNRKAAYLGWRPKDSSAPFRDEVLAEAGVPDADAADAVYQGGVFVNEPIRDE
ncbi:NAD-dependent epimerase/dehydratase family protein [Arhodomonas sp. AD133]|uniref:NAD-dependent epimerase/dehydratase family protein n=1 Tax=Arhodomonas sp. AD133 TaxID=3415009 RepID=UPI003EBC6016